MKLRYVIERGFDPPHDYSRQPFYLATVDRNGEYAGDLKGGGLGMETVDAAKAAIQTDHPELKWHPSKSDDSDELWVSSWYEDEGWD